MFTIKSFTLPERDMLLLSMEDFSTSLQEQILRVAQMTCISSTQWQNNGIKYSLQLVIARLIIKWVSKIRLLDLEDRLIYKYKEMLQWMNRLKIQFLNQFIASQKRDLELEQFLTETACISLVGTPGREEFTSMISSNTKFQRCNGTSLEATHLHFL